MLLKCLRTISEKQVGGFYRDVELKPGYDQETEVEKKKDLLKELRKQETKMSLLFLNVMSI